MPKENCKKHLLMAMIEVKQRNVSLRIEGKDDACASL